LYIEHLWKNDVAATATPDPALGCGEYLEAALPVAEGDLGGPAKWLSEKPICQLATPKTRHSGGVALRTILS
jgi:hypothetical protein